MPFTLDSPAFTHEAEIPGMYTCEGRDVSPALSWTGVPENAKSFVLIVDDPDAPDPKAPKTTWVHWVLYNIPASTRGFALGVKPSDLPVGTKQGLNDWNKAGYGGPCPPIGRHRYYHKLYVLDTLLPDLGSEATKQMVVDAMKGHVVAETVLMGTYQKEKG